MTDYQTLYNETRKEADDAADANAQAADRVSRQFAADEYRRVLEETGSMTQAFKAWVEARKA